MANSANGRIEQIVTEMVDALRAAITDFEVADWPDKPEAFQFYHDNGALLVRYDGSQFTGDAMGDTVQDWELQFVVTVIARDLAADAGIYRALEDTRRVLTGRRFSACQRTYPVSEGLVKRMGSVWRFDQVFRMQTSHIGALDSDTGPILRQTTVEEA